LNEEGEQGCAFHDPVETVQPHAVWNIEPRFAVSVGVVANEHDGLIVVSSSLSRKSFEQRRKERHLRSSALDLPLHADFGLVTERRRTLLLDDPPPKNPARCLQIRAPTRSRDRLLHHRAEKSAKPFVWAKPAKAIFDKLADVPEPSV
jgi:hypothetical protein